ncbi:hypothetical protein [Pseudoalteromonas phenolica]|uniref:DUF304 domain-containing protein n=1 Tax=Pseudoalteromonas phenolica TaxID=161398 RepID=A0A0S2K1H7_9GAMM|nr:hypothetical protein [Pseudoalteromonas phenolica]ALO42346.1 hypothetical protein PP2015_1845 [Pseudoalteromonas phenolica]MBE0356558.1 hypothetical protein [Pseudoalteromonas phenolica O-BC30]TMO54224.1 hypothetical protein CWC21_16060 [Pseudoalteromonas phenolica]|tara:strand:- start:191 stop:598 length:408 start_codon:yes stop_codon:yes gene_type:complete
MYEIKSSINFGFYILAASVIALLLSISTAFNFTAWLEALEMILIFALTLFVCVTLIQTLMGKRTSSWCINGLSYYNFLGVQKYVPIEQIQQVKVHTIICCKVTHVKLEEKNIFLFSCKLTTQQKSRLAQLGYFAK